MKEGKVFILESKEGKPGEQANKRRKAKIEETLGKLDEKRPFGSGDLVATLEGPHAHKGLLVVETKDNGMVKVVTKHGEPTIEIPKAKLWHYDDYREAFHATEIEEQLAAKDKTK